MKTTLDMPRARKIANVNVLPMRKPPAEFKSRTGISRKTGLDMKAFAAAVEEGTKLWRDIPDHVAWVRDIRGVPNG